MSLLLDFVQPIARLIVKLIIKEKQARDKFAQSVKQTKKT